MYESQKIHLNINQWWWNEDSNRKKLIIEIKIILNQHHFSSKIGSIRISKNNMPKILSNFNDSSMLENFFIQIKVLSQKKFLQVGLKNKTFSLRGRFFFLRKYQYKPHIGTSQLSWNIRKWKNKTFLSGLMFYTVFF